MNKLIAGLAKCLLILFTCLIVSCNSKKGTSPLNVIPIASSIGNYNILNLSDYASEIRYIPLETDESLLVGANPRISYENGYILIWDASQNCYLFDENGKFCRKIGRHGDGPYEHYFLSQAFLQEDLIFLNDLEKLLIYDLNGQPIERINLQSGDIPEEYRRTGDGYLFPLRKDTFVMSVLSMQGYYPKAILFEAHPSGAKMIKEYPNFITLDKVKKGFVGGERGFMYRFQNEVRIYKGTNDTLFTIGQNTEINTAFILDLKEYAAPLSFFEFKEEDISAARKKYIFPNAIYESLNYLFIDFDFGNYAPESFVYAIPSRGTQATNQNVYSVFDKHKGEFILMRQPVKGKLGFKNDVDNGPIIWPTYITANEELVSLIHPEEFMEYYDNITNPSTELTEIANKIELDDNPIVMVAKLK